MPKFLKKLLFLGCLGALIYFLLGYHIIIIGGGANFRLLKKSEYTLQYTIFSTKGKPNKNILAIDVLREDGIGSLLIEEGLMSEEQEQIILERLDRENNNTY